MILTESGYFKTPSLRFPGEQEFVWLDCERRRIVTAITAFVAPRKTVCAPVHFLERSAGEVQVRHAQGSAWLLHTCRAVPSGLEWRVEGRTLQWERIPAESVPEWAKEAFSRGSAQLESNPA
jgi:hypothetical protein